MAERGTPPTVKLSYGDVLRDAIDHAETLRSYFSHEPSAPLSEVKHREIVRDYLQMKWEMTAGQAMRIADEAVAAVEAEEA